MLLYCNHPRLRRQVYFQPPGRFRLHSRGCGDLDPRASPPGEDQGRRHDLPLRYLATDPDLAQA